MENEHFKISMKSLNTSVPNYTSWTKNGLVREYKRTRSLNRQKAIWDELRKRGCSYQEINELLTNSN